MLSGDEIPGRLKTHRQDLEDRFTVRRIGLFGSFLRGAARETSDVDILVEFDRPSFDHCMDLRFSLENLLNRPVDLVSADRLKPRIRPAMAREVAFA